MLIVTQRSFTTKHDQVIGYFQDIRAIYDHFSGLFGKYGLESRFSHNQFEVIVTSTYRLSWREDITGTEHAMVITNQAGIRYSKEFVTGIFAKYRKSSYRRYWCGGVRHYRGCYRRIRTTQERKLSLGVLKEEGEPVWRQARNYHNLPSRWDDIAHLDVCNRNWKRFRKTQWK